MNDHPTEPEETQTVNTIQTEALANAREQAGRQAQAAVNARVANIEADLADQIAAAVGAAVADAVGTIPALLAGAVERQLARVPDLVAAALEQAMHQQRDGLNIPHPIPAGDDRTQSTATQLEPATNDVEQIDTLSLADGGPDLCQTQDSEDTVENRNLDPATEGVGEADTVDPINATLDRLGTQTTDPAEVEEPRRLHRLRVADPAAVPEPTAAQTLEVLPVHAPGFLPDEQADATGQTAATQATDEPRNDTPPAGQRMARRRGNKRT